MNTEEKINIILENQKFLMKEMGFIEELLKAMLVNNVLDSAESVVKNDSELSQLKAELAEKEEELEKLRIECKSLHIQIENTRVPSEAEAEARAYMGCAFRLPVGYCEHANGKAWRMIDAQGCMVLLKRGGKHKKYRCEEWFYFNEIKKFYEDV